MSYKKPGSLRPSAQLRLAPKAEMNKPSFKPPVDVKYHDLLSPPYTPRIKGGSTIQTKISTHSDVDEIVMKLKTLGQSPKVTTGINDHRSDEMIPESSKGPMLVIRGKKETNVKEASSESEASNETIKITANLGDGKRKVKIKNIPKWNGKQVYDPFASYHEDLNKPGTRLHGWPHGYNVRAAEKTKKSVHFGPTATLLGPSDSNSQIKNVDISKINKQVEELKASEEEKKSESPLSPPLTPRTKSCDSTGPSISRFKEPKAAATLRRPNFNDCICLRSLKLVLCISCESTFYGRLKKNCKSHPNDLYELDIDACPKCCEKNMDGLKECDLPQEMGYIANRLITK